MLRAGSRRTRASVLRACREGPTLAPNRSEGRRVGPRHGDVPPVTGVNITAAQPVDRDGIEALLEREHLPLAGLHEYPQQMFVARAGNRVIGCASLELYGRRCGAA